MNKKEFTKVTGLEIVKDADGDFSLTTKSGIKMASLFREYSAALHKAKYVGHVKGGYVWIIRLDDAAYKMGINPTVTHGNGHSCRFEHTHSEKTQADVLKSFAADFILSNLK